MSFITLPGLPGKVFVPETNPDREKKHACPDCFSCRMCCDTRCRACRCGKNEPAGTPLITIKSVAAGNYGIAGFKDLHWKIGRNQHWAIIGPTGSGKSALAEALIGRPRRPGTDVRYFFEDPEQFPEGRGRYHPDDIIDVSADGSGPVQFRDGFYQARWHSMIETAFPTVGDFLLNEKGRSGPGIQADACPVRALPKNDENRLLKQLGIDRLLDRRLIHLSTGEQHKVRIARALLGSPRLLVFKEPFSGLDTRSRESLRLIIEDLLASANPQLLLVVSRPEDLISGITHLMTLHDHRITAMGPFDQVLPRKAAAKPPVTRAEPASPCPEATNISGETAGRELIRMTGTTVIYGKVRVLDGVDWTMRSDEHWAILGPNGAGKSTLLSLVTADNPQAYVNDITLFGMKRGSGESIWDIKKHIGWMAPELRMFYPGDTFCISVVCSGFYDSIGLFRNSTPAQIQAARETMAKFEILELEQTPFYRISAGQQRLVLLARAMVKKPDLLILDEPCQGLDAQKRQMIIAALDGMSELESTRLIYVTHYVEEIPRAITHALFLEEGRVAACSRMKRH